MDGDGSVELGSGYWTGNYATPFQSDSTDPEELLAAGHASCFSMMTAYLLDEHGYAVDRINTDAAVTLELSDEGFDIPSIELTVSATVPDADEASFDEVLEQAETTCPVSKALDGTEIQVTGTLES